MEENQKSQTTNLTASSLGSTQGATSGQQPSMRVQTIPNSAPNSASPSGTTADTQEESRPEQMYPDMKRPVREWGTEHYRYFAELLRSYTPGEMVMLMCNIKRRKDLYPLVYVANNYSEERLILRWDDPSVLKEGKRVLPPIKVNSDGSVHISMERLTRMGLFFTPGNTLRLQKIGPFAFKMEFMSSTL